MARNIEMNYKTSSGSYEAVYPSVMVDNIGDLQSYLEENYYNKGEVDGNTWAVGDIRPSTRTDLSDDWHLCDGSGVSSVSWPELYQIRSEDWKPFASYQESSMYNAIQNNTNFARDPVTGLEIYITSLTLNTISFNYRFSFESVTWKSTSVSIAFSSSYGTLYVRKIVGYNNTFGICVELNDTAYAVPLVYKNETFIATTRPFRNNGNYDDWYDAFCNEYGIHYISGQQNTLNIAKQDIGSATSANMGENIKLPYTSVYMGQINCCLVGKYMICGGQIKLNSTNFNEQFMVNSINLDNMSIRTLYNTTIDIKTTRYAINFLSVIIIIVIFS